MNAPSKKPGRWWANGLLFENCNCQIVCPGHMHFDQLCTYEKCLGYWAIQIEDGGFNAVALSGVKALLAFESPRRMIEGNWVQQIVIDESASNEQRSALETIFSGQVGGPWAVLGRFVSKRNPTRFAPIHIEDAGRSKRVVVENLVESSLEAIRGRDKTKTVKFENIFNQIHAASQVIARGSTHYDDGVIVFDTKDSHALYSNFSWSVET